MDCRCTKADPGYPRTPPLQVKVGIPSSAEQPRDLWPCSCCCIFLPVPSQTALRSEGGEHEARRSVAPCATVRCKESSPSLLFQSLSCFFSRMHLDSQASMAWWAEVSQIT